MIEFDHVSFSYSDTQVLDDVCFRMEDSQFIGILGPNGGGKSTFLRLCLDLLKPSKGKIIRKEKRVSYIAQTTSISDSSFPATVEEVISLGLVNSHLDLNHRERRQSVLDMMEKMSLLPYRKRLVNELSGGQLQRVKIAKAMILRPTLLVLDEPDAGMDELSHGNLISSLVELHEKEKTGILFVSHHPHDLEKADSIYFIEQGKICTYQEEMKRGHHHVDL